MVYFYSYVVEQKGINARIGCGDGDFYIERKINSIKELVGIQRKIKESLFKDFNYSKEEHVIIFTAFNPL